LDLTVSKICSSKNRATAKLKTGYSGAESSIKFKKMPTAIEKKPTGLAKK